MRDPITRLNTALEGRYATEREPAIESPFGSSILEENGHNLSSHRT